MSDTAENGPRSPRQNDGSLHIAMIGTRGVPAQYGGFETAIEEIGQRLVKRGHRVTVYCRTKGAGTEHLGMQRIELPSMKRRSLETLSNSALACTHAALRLRPDMAFVFNSANSPWLPILRSVKIPIALHTDGLEWQRSKWGRVGRQYYWRAESWGVKWADELISDAQGIADYYQGRFAVGSNVIAYGAPIVHPAVEPITALGLQPRGYDLIVARLEPENHVREGLEGALGATGDRPIVFVGSNPYPTDYATEVDKIARGNDRVLALGSVWDQELLDSLYAHARVYIHGHSVGGTNPSLLRAMGAGAAVAAYDVSFNREVLDDGSMLWGSAGRLTQLLEQTADEKLAALGEVNQAHVAAKYRWDDVTSGYEDLAYKLVNGGKANRCSNSSSVQPTGNEAR
ncbi:MAG TPA: DUF1972 domain-containing protein [Candidatus Acidoferrum sp.]|jgi:glycosyltransferase involved in cell wall biosynthesis|nr:DUF1972 domain-containing protein [Candidatus Acidoferrum sp.]